MHLPGRPVAGFDPEGLVFAAGINNEQVKLYDLRSFDKVSPDLNLMYSITLLCMQLFLNYMQASLLEIAIFL